MIAYPLLFKPILQNRIWGGVKLNEVLNKPYFTETTGESWELSAVNDNISEVVNGIHQHKNLQELIHQYPEEILGTAVLEQYGKNFPLLFKFLDAKENLSIQLHPNDALAKERHNSFGKTEMWYVMQADEGAKLVVGFKKNSNEKEYLNYLNQNKIVDLLNEIPVKKGDVFFLETGTIHAIGAGCVIAEIQQTSDITYRIFDFNRKDEQGNERELHTQLALDAINYNITPCKKSYEAISNQSVNVVTCNYFTTNFLQINQRHYWQKTKNSFTVFMCTEGSFTIENNHESFAFKMGDTVLIPALLTEFEIKGVANLLEITI